MFPALYMATTYSITQMSNHTNGLSSVTTLKIGLEIRVHIAVNTGIGDGQGKRSQCTVTLIHGHFLCRRANLSYNVRHVVWATSAKSN